ncbi:MAG TPA: hypothetical protein VN903_29935 [Polyangia bacterium]|nr:hypothetical protein [Polyangia bacterium]
MDVLQRVRARVRDELAHRRISQRVAAERLSLHTGELWTQSKVHKILTGEVGLQFVDLVAFARVIDISLVELVRDPGLEFSAEMTPSEMKLVAAVRDKPRILPALLEIVGEPDPRKPGRLTIRERMRRKE